MVSLSEWKLAHDVYLFLSTLDLSGGRVILSRILHGHAATSSEMVLRLEEWLGVEHGRDACIWLALQAEHDLWQAAQRHSEAISHVQRRLPKVCDDTTTI